MGSLKGDPIGQYQFHLPLFASMWSVVREATVVPAVFSRGVKEMLGAAVSQGNLCRLCCCWHSNSACEAGIEGRSLWRDSSLIQLSHCEPRIKAILLWFRDAIHPGFFETNVRSSGIIMVRHCCCMLLLSLGRAALLWRRCAPVVS
jgi:hypothetical protein